MKNKIIPKWNIDFQDFLKFWISEQFLQSNLQDIKEKLNKWYTKLDFKIKMLWKINHFTINFTEKDINYLINKNDI